MHRSGARLRRSKVSTESAFLKSVQTPRYVTQRYTLPIQTRIRTELSEAAGSVRARANKYRLCWDEANPGSCGLQDGQHGHGPPEELESAASGGNMLVVAGARTEKVAQLIVSPAEPGG